MIGMAMGVEHSIDAGKLVAQSLLAKIGSGIDQHDAVVGAVVPLQQN
jgi:hypothetical protein